MLDIATSVAAAMIGVGAIVWGAERFAEHLACAATRLGVSTPSRSRCCSPVPNQKSSPPPSPPLCGVRPQSHSVTSSAPTSPPVSLPSGSVRWSRPSRSGPGSYATQCSACPSAQPQSRWHGMAGSTGSKAPSSSPYTPPTSPSSGSPSATPAFGETAEVEEAAEQRSSRVGKELAYVLAGLAAMVVGATLLVDGIRDLVDAEAAQIKLSLTIVGFATGFELVVLAWSSARRRISDAVVAGVVGSYAYNATMTLAPPLSCDRFESPTARCSTPRCSP